MSDAKSRPDHAEHGLDCLSDWTLPYRERSKLVDRITTSLLKEFSKLNQIEKLDESQQFEHMAAYLALRRHYSRALDTDQIVIGSSGDTGLDAIGIVANGQLLTDIDQVQELVENNGYLEVTFVFVQAERSESFSGAKLSNIIDGVVDFFSDKPKLIRNEQVRDFSEIMATVFDNSNVFRRPPSCHVYYVTTGATPVSEDMSGRIEMAKKRVKGIDLFGVESVDCMGSSDIRRLFQQVKQAVSRDFIFDEKVEIPAIAGVDLAYIGYLPAEEYIDIIKDDAGDDILGSIFYDNVRDWQDYNPVNSDIRATLSSETQERFVLMNNGVTIIARTIKQSGRKFTIEDFQVVNGCQTSHVLFHQRDSISPDVRVPIRLIGTSDVEVSKSIVFATNNQTTLSPEQLYALTEFSQKLEEYFGTFPEKSRLYYERRDGQYDKLAIKKARVVTPQALIKSFAAMFLNDPYASNKQYKSLRERVGKDIFAKGHCLEPYYSAALAAYSLDLLFNRKAIDPKYKSARYHILLAARLLVDPSPIGPLNSREVQRRGDTLIKAFSGTAESVEGLFHNACNVIDEVSGGNLERDNIRTRKTTELILKKLERKSSEKKGT